MNKYALLGVIFFILLIVTYFVDITNAYTLSTDLNNVSAPEETASVVSIFSMIKTFFRIATFRVDGIPFILNGVFTTMSIVVIFMIADIVKDLIPFT